MYTKIVRIKGRRGGSGARGEVSMKVIIGLIDMQQENSEQRKKEMKGMVLSPIQHVTLHHLERDDDQGNEKMESRSQEYREQEVCPFSLMSSCHMGIGGNWGNVRT